MAHLKVKIKKHSSSVVFQYSTFSDPNYSYYISNFY